MQDEKERKPADSTSDDATSSETLSDVEENESVSEERGDSGSSVPIAPDGALNFDNSEQHPKADVDPT